MRGVFILREETVGVGKKLETECGWWGASLYTSHSEGQHLGTKQLKHTSSRELHDGHRDKLARSSHAVCRSRSSCQQLDPQQAPAAGAASTRQKQRFAPSGCSPSLSLGRCFIPDGVSLGTKIISQTNILVKTNLSKGRHEADPLEDHPQNHCIDCFYLIVLQKWESFCQELHAVIKGQGLCFWFWSLCGLNRKAMKKCYCIFA